MHDHTVAATRLEKRPTKHVSVSRAKKKNSRVFALASHWQPADTHIAEVLLLWCLLGSGEVETTRLAQPICSCPATFGKLLERARANGWPFVRVRPLSCHLLIVPVETQMVAWGVKRRINISWILRRDFTW